MEQRRLGNSGLMVSAAGLGCNNFGTIPAEQGAKVVDAAIDAGITLFDTADVYGNRGGSESFLGDVLGPRRQKIVLATKAGMPMGDGPLRQGASRRRLMLAVEESLTRLKTDWIDLYQIHAPDPLTPIEETLSALDDLVTQGKVRYVGCSNFSAWSVVDALWTSSSRNLVSFVSAQDELSLLMRKHEAELLPALSAKGMSLLPYFPLASGLLSGKYARNAEQPQGARLTAIQRLADRFMTEENWRRVEKISDIAAQSGHSMLDLAWGWLLAKPVVASVIAGATKPEQIVSNVAAAGAKLPPDIISALNDATR